MPLGVVGRGARREGMRREARGERREARGDVARGARRLHVETLHCNVSGAPGVRDVRREARGDEARGERGCGERGCGERREKVCT